MIRFLKLLGCQGPLGMASRAVTDEQFTASSESVSGHNAAHQGRLNFTTGAGGAWTAYNSDMNPWLQIDLFTLYRVTLVATQGGGDSDTMWVTQYQLQYSNNDTAVEFQTYKEPGNDTDKVT